VITLPHSVTVFVSGLMELMEYFVYQGVVVNRMEIGQDSLGVEFLAEL
jgi:hypothetical protein